MKKIISKIRVHRTSFRPCTALLFSLFFVTSFALTAQTDSELSDTNLQYTDTSMPQSGANYGLTNFRIQTGFNFVQGLNGQLSAGSDLMTSTIGGNGLFINQFATIPALNSNFQIDQLNFNYVGTPGGLGAPNIDHWTIGTIDEGPNRKSLSITETFGDDAIALETALYIKAWDIFEGGNNVGIRTDTPTEALDVNGKIALTSDPGNEMIIINSDRYIHGSGFQIFGVGDDHFIMASKEGSNETAGIYGDGDALTFWSTGDGTDGLNGYIFVADEDAWDDDADPLNDNALVAYLNSFGNWVSTVPPPARSTQNKSTLNALKIVGEIPTFEFTPQLEIKVGVKNATPSKPILSLDPITLEKVLPQAIERSASGAYFVNYDQITLTLIAAVSELSTEKQALTERLEKLESLVKQLLDK